MINYRDENLIVNKKIIKLLLLKLIIMERKDFIEKVGLSGAAILVFGCFQSCSKEGTTPTTPGNNTGGNNPTKPIDFTIDLSSSTYASLQNAGGFYLDTANNIIIARTVNRDLIAVSSLCTHQGVTVAFQANNNRFYCSAHGSAFSTTGAVTMGPAASALTQYKTTLTGNSLRVYA